jgi:hypothetical protein
MQTKSEAAAFQTNVLLEKIVREKLLSFAGTMTCVYHSSLIVRGASLLTELNSRPPLLVPAMHVHLLNSKSADPLSRQISLNKLDFCMLLLGELQAAYDSAGVFRGVFLEAIRRGAPASAARSMGSNSMPPMTSDAVPADFTPSCLTFEDGFFDELVGEGSISSFWDWVGSTEWNV